MTSETPRVRTSDAERERVAEALRNAVSEGRLTLGEGDERLATLYATKYRDELGQLIADLPPAPDAGGGRRRGHGPGWGAGPGWGNPAAPGAGWGGPGWPGPGGPASGGTVPGGSGQAGDDTGPGQGWGGQGYAGQGYGGPGYGGPGYGGPGYGGPGYGHPGWGGLGWGRRSFGPWRLVRLLVIVGVLMAIASISSGHFFFFPLIPLAFIGFGLLRCGVLHRWHRGRS